MSGWFYSKEGMFSDEEVGPLADGVLLQMAFDGKLKLRSKVRHEKHTRGQWVYLENIPAAKGKIEAGEKHRSESKAAEQAARAEAKRQAAEAKQRAAEAAERERVREAEAFADSPLARFLADGQDPAMVSKVHQRISQLLTSQEVLEYIAVAVTVPGLQPDCVVATNRRFMVVHQKLLGRMDFEDYTWFDLFDAQLKEGMLTSEVTLRHISGRLLRLGLLPKPQARCIYRICQEREEVARRMRHDRMLEERRAAAGGIHVNVPVAASAPVASPAPVVAAVVADDPVAKLQKLKQMLDAGLIEQSEYDDTKRRILAAM